MSRALVTGATRGAGRAVAAALAHAGYETCALGRDRLVLDELRSDFGVLPMAIDLTDRDAVRMIIEGMRPDIVVHAALRWPAEMAFEKLTEADIDMALEVNLSATLHLTRVVLPVMKQRRQGAFFVISPGSGEGGPLIERTVTGASQTFARALQDEVAGEGVVVEHFFAGEPPFTSVVASIHNKLKTDRLMPVGHTQNHRGTHNAT